MANPARELLVRLAAVVDKNALPSLRSFESAMKRVAKSALQLGANLGVMALTMRVLGARLFQRTYQKGFELLAGSLDLVAEGAERAVVWLERFDQGYGIINRRMVENAQAMVRQADALQVTTDEYQQLLFVGQEYGAAQEDVVTALMRISRAAQDAVKGMGEYGAFARDQFERLGISLDQLQGKKPMQLLEMVAEGVQQRGGNQKAISGLYGLLGEEMGVGEGIARRLVPVLKQGREGLMDMRRAARDLGLTIDQRLLKAGNRLATQWRTLRAQLNALTNSIGLELVPVVERIVSRVQRWVVVTRRLIEVPWRRFVGFVNRTASAIDYLADSLDDFQSTAALIVTTGITLKIMVALSAFSATVIGVVMTVQGLSAVLGLFGVSLGAVMSAIAASLTGLGVWVASIAGITVAAGGAAAAILTLGTVVGFLTVAAAAAIPVFVAVGALIDDLIAFGSGQESVIGYVFDRLDRSMPAMRELVPLLGAVGHLIWEAGVTLGKFFMELIDGFVGGLGFIFRELLDFFTELIPGGEGLAKMLRRATTDINSMADALERVRESLEWISEAIKGFTVLSGSGFTSLAQGLAGALPGGSLAMPLGTSFSNQLVGNYGRHVAERAGNTVTINQRNTFTGVNDSTRRDIEDAGARWTREARQAVEGSGL